MDIDCTKDWSHFVEQVYLGSNNNSVDTDRTAIARRVGGKSVSFVFIFLYNLRNFLRGGTFLYVFELYNRR